VRVYVSDLVIGDKIQKDVFNSTGVHILSADTQLTGQEIAKLVQHNVPYVDIQFRPSSVKSSKSSYIQNAPEPIQTLYSHAVDSLRSLFRKATVNSVITPDDVAQFCDPLLESFENQTDIVALLLTLTVKDDYTYLHSAQVGMIAYFIAKWLGKSESDARVAGKAGYLHDIGKSKIPSAMLQKPANLTPAEFEEIKNHTLYGYEILKRSYGNSVYSVVALQHHERLDGTGYPHGLKEDEIHPISRIVAVADVYSAMITERVYQKERNLLTVLQELHRLSFSELDPVVTHAFIKHMIPNLIGKNVRLNSGELGIITLTNPTDFFRPLIQLHDGGFLDLSSKFSEGKSIEQIYI
jgi:putative nucleotidyltransferase with HDIG domain